MIIVGYPVFGWIQNPNNFGKLKKTVQIFSPGSKYHNELLNGQSLGVIYHEEQRIQMIKTLKKDKIVFQLSQLKGHPEYFPGTAHRRSNQIANGLVQISAGHPVEIYTDSSKTWTDDYTAGSFVNWALTLGFLKINDDYDVSITEKGIKFSNSEDGSWISSKNYKISQEECNILKDVIASYPPAVRILRLLYENKSNANSPLLTKFQLGGELGFSGEPGFTSFDEDEWFKYLLTLNKKEQTKFRQNVEGSADKWARGICSWLYKLGLISKENKYSQDGTNISTGYKINLSGEFVLKKSIGNSSNKPCQKYIDWTMLATKVSNAVYIRKRRAVTLKAISKSSSKEYIIKELKDNDVYDGDGVVKSDVLGLIRFGLNIDIKDGKYVWKDNINDFYIPNGSNSMVIDDIEIKKIKDGLQNDLSYVDPKDIEIVEMAWKKSATKSENTVDATLFEIRVVDIMKKYISLEGNHLGGENKPDGFLYYNNNYGIILDTKCYSNGYNLPIDQQREMQDYILSAINKTPRVPENEWWSIIPIDISTEDYKFLWVAGDFTGSYKKGIEQTKLKTGINGSAIDVVNLLKLADKVSGQSIGVLDVPELMSESRIVI